MEFIVKIGADQQGLNEMLQRMTTEFKHMNTSMPTAWGVHQSAVGQYGKILKGTTEVADSFGDTAINSLQKKATGFLKGMVLGSLTSLILEGLETVNKKFWESFYNSGEEAMNRMADLSERVTSTVSNLQAARATAEARREREMSPRALADYLRGKRGKLEGDVSRFQSDYETAKQVADDLRSGVATHADGRRFTDFERQASFLRASEAETRLLNAREKLAQLNDRIRTATEMDQKQTQDGIAAQFKSKENKTAKIELVETVREVFQADQMAQAGLYSGSSLLFNPNLTIQQQQLDALQQISNNTAKIGEGAFS